MSAQQCGVGWLNRSNLERRVSYYIWVFVYNVVKQLTGEVTNAPKSHTLQEKQQKTPQSRDLLDLPLWQSLKIINEHT